MIAQLLKRLGDALFADRLEFLRSSLVTSFDDRLESLLEHLRLSLKSKREWSTVLLLPPDNNEVLSRRIFVPTDGTRARATFEPQRDIPKGSWVVLLGPGRIDNVCVGNMAQSSGFPSDGPLFKLKDDHTIGTNITVTVQGES